MEINCKITILINSDGMTIELYDDDANIRFVELNLTNNQSMQALSRLSHTEVNYCTVRGLDKLGKNRESKELIFKMPDDKWSKERKDIARKLALEQSPEGWKPSMHFGSQNSFFL